MDPTNPYTSDGLGPAAGSLPRFGFRCRCRSRSGRPNCGRRLRSRLTVCRGLRTTSDADAAADGSIRSALFPSVEMRRKRETGYLGCAVGLFVGLSSYQMGHGPARHGGKRPKEEKERLTGEKREDGAEHGAAAGEEQAGAAVVRAAAGPLPRRHRRPPPPARRARHRGRRRRRLQRPQPPPRPLLRLRRPLFRLRFVRTLPGERPVRRRRAAVRRGVQETRQGMRGGWPAHPHRQQDRRVAPA
uniref:Uncharacterized protein n=1 Tax=Triticum urartu TaxID=4572 RepID=A0A8R7QLF9_TRIUA